MMETEDLLDSLGGSLLNDLLSELNAATDDSNHSNDDEVLALLERELASTYYRDRSDADDALPMMMGGGGGRPTAASFVVDNQQRLKHATMDLLPVPASGGGIGDGSDEWSASISRFGSMSLVSDFLAADTATKEQLSGSSTTRTTSEERVVATNVSNNDGRRPFEELFDYDGDDEEYALEEDVGGGVGVGTTITGGTAAMGDLASLLLGASSRSRKAPSASTAATAMALDAAGRTPEVVPPPIRGGASSSEVGRSPPSPPPPSVPKPPPGPIAFAPHQIYHPMPVLPPTAIFPHHHQHHQHQHHPAMALNYNPILPPPPHTNVPSGGLILPPPPPAPVIVAPFDDDEFPALGTTTEVASARVDGIIPTSPVAEATSAVVVVGGGAPPPPSMAQCILNNPNPRAPPIDARLVSSGHMPSKDVCLVVHMMLRSLKSLDAYNDDYYHWSVANKVASNIMGILPPPGVGIAAGNVPLPNPVWKETKVLARAQEEKFETAVRARAKTFSDKNRSLGQLERSNVKRPKALLNTPAMRRDDDAESGAMADSKYESEQQSGRIQLWKARVTIDRGYTALLSLIELRRLIQANVGAPGLIGDLMVDVKANVDLLHSSLGVSVQVNSMEGKTIDVDDERLARTLSMPKGRVLCTRAIEEGILPHSSACAILPMTLMCILSSPSSADAEDRLIHALTGLILLTNPSVDPMIFCRCLDVPISLARDNKNDISAIASSRMRMNLLHAILSMGKDVCAGSRASEDWSQREDIFRVILEESQK
ncbi:hypothetical protein ACHAXA_000270 [Cyclostephanos tholiformis]|uniref:Uncharacterized protein n=1 Tax=Cyclostephanos tholiformis TaxID=382380 RepID=A0ABD3SBI6_9STRA